MERAIFLDRDGVIVENRATYIRSWEDVAFIPQAVQALAALSKLDHKVILVTNQSAVGRGLISLEKAHSINNRIVDWVVQNGARIDGVYLCPHKPEDLCNCRKPEPGMVLEAARKFNLALRSSILIGDALTDLQAGRTGGVGGVFLVRTGRGAEQEAQQATQEFRPDGIFDTLAAAVEAIFFMQIS